MRFIPAFFISDTGPKSGLSPIIKIYQWDPVNSVLNKIKEDTMIDLGDGNYHYPFREYNKNNLYYYNIDAGTDDVSNRYATGSNELDYYGNKEDWGNLIRGAFVNIDKNIANMVSEEVKKTILSLKIEQPSIDFSPFLDKLEQINNNKTEINIPIEDITDVVSYEISKINTKDDVIKINSELKKRTKALEVQLKNNEKLLNDMMKQIQNQNELLQKQMDYIEKIMKRENITQDDDFVSLVNEIKKSKKEEKRLIKELSIFVDNDFNKLLNELGGE